MTPPSCAQPRAVMYVQTTNGNVRRKEPGEPDIPPGGYPQWNYLHFHVQFSFWTSVAPLICTLAIPSSYIPRRKQPQASTEPLSFPLLPPIPLSNHRHIPTVTFSIPSHTSNSYATRCVTPSPTPINPCPRSAETVPLQVFCSGPRCGAGGSLPAGRRESRRSS